MNPQVQLFLEEPSTVIISLNQHSFMEPKIIGFSVYLLASGKYLFIMFVSDVKKQIFMGEKYTMKHHHKIHELHGSVKYTMGGIIAKCDLIQIT